jgi:hypothetical protein
MDMNIKELEAGLQAVGDNQNTEGVEFMASIFPDQLPGFMLRLSKWLEKNHLSRVNFSWDGEIARVRLVP